MLAAGFRKGRACIGRFCHVEKSHRPDRKSTRLNSSHSQISYAVFCLKKKNNDYSPALGRIITTTAVGRTNQNVAAGEDERADITNLTRLSQSQPRLDRGAHFTVDSYC